MCCQPDLHSASDQASRKYTSMYAFGQWYSMVFHFLLNQTHRERQRHRQREKQAPCREPHAGLQTRTPGLGSLPEPKADAQPLTHHVLRNDILILNSQACHSLCRKIRWSPYSVPL
ncbi:hypothetical protein VULLAG_LOCUS5081 [Vulpes lagopus]